MKLRITISRAIFAFGMLTVLGLLSVIFASNYALSQLKVGGPLYDKIKLGNDLVADILPPPEYVIEAYLEVTLALQDPASLTTRRDRLVQLKKDYDDRRDFWSKSDLDPAIKSKLTGTSHGEVTRFWNAVEQSFLPAIAKGDMALATKSYAEITAAYTAHRAVIDEIVKRTNDDNAATEAEANGRVKFFTWVLWGISAFVLLLVGAGVGGIAKGVLRPIVGMTGAMQRLAGGELDKRILLFLSDARTRWARWPARWRFSKRMPCAFSRWRLNADSRPRRLPRNAKPPCSRWLRALRTRSETF